MDKKSYIIFAVVAVVILTFAKLTYTPQNTNVTQSETSVDEVESDVSKTASSTTSEQPHSGENAKIKSFIFVATTKEDLDEFVNYASAKNEEAIKRMAARGKLIPIEKDERVTVVDSGFFSSEIEIIKTGERGFVPNEFLIKE
jgi:cytoskeletal protein RodZ